MNLLKNVTLGEKNEEIRDNIWNLCFKKKLKFANVEMYRAERFFF